MNDEKIEISVGEVTGMAARVHAHYTGPEEVELRGTLRGPFCKTARTLPTDFPFRALGPDRPNAVEAVVINPCLWSEELPQMYKTEVEAVSGDEVVATLNVSIGLHGKLIVREYD